MRASVQLCHRQLVANRKSGSLPRLAVSILVFVHHLNCFLGWVFEVNFLGKCPLVIVHDGGQVIWQLLGGIIPPWVLRKPLLHAINDVFIMNVHVLIAVLSLLLMLQANDMPKLVSSDPNHPAAFSKIHLLLAKVVEARVCVTTSLIRTNRQGMLEVWARFSEQDASLRLPQAHASQRCFFGFRVNSLLPLELDNAIWPRFSSSSQPLLSHVVTFPFLQHGRGWHLSTGT
mmetsp:Transcript_31729/g.74113  ORF Transcript_31729/g.74113 Transcript_31729/m.74113 type:complete len:230 (+) Transcript_31729:263-952(+)